MIKKTVEYLDYNGNERKEDYYFNVSEPEILDGVVDDLSSLIKMIQSGNDPDGKTIIKTFKELVLKAYGVIGDDGRRFVKSEELSTAFSQTEAYSKIFMGLATDTKEALLFIKGILPADIAKDIVID